MQKLFTKRNKNFWVLLALLFLMAYSQPIRAQSLNETAIARQHLEANAAQQNLTPLDVNGMTVSSAYRSPTTGWYHVYFNQNYQSIDVYSRLASMVVIDNTVRYTTHNFVPNLASKLLNKSARANIDPLGALQRAAADVGLTASPAQLKAASTKSLSDGTVTQVIYTDSSLSDNPINVQLYWLPYQKKEDKRTTETVVLTWRVHFLTKDQQNAWSIHIDAQSGEVVQKNDDVIHCNFGTPKHTQGPHICTSTRAEATYFGRNLVANSYTVFDYPLESPSHGSRTVSSSPYTRFAPSGAGPGTTNGWHNNGTTDFTTTRGNNVWAQEDVNDNDGIGASPSSPTLEFDYPYTLGPNTAAGNQNAAITNLFYWNNLIHDVLWQYGFDEPSGNFQNNNQGRGGLGNDFVYADAQDGGGTDNANFYTPTDGTNGRMQMYLFTEGNGYQPDGDFDNGIIAHEYGHGWSIRLTGGPNNSSCLDNAEQGGEGWSDYLGLMLTTDWASLSPDVASANIPRGIGTYALTEPITGDGIRPYRYSYDMVNVNGPVTYKQVSNLNFSEPHGIGSIWATMLWDMTWEIIMQDSQIIANIYTLPSSATAMRGNVAALKLVNEGLRLQPCSPSFVQARDAILQADQLLFGGRYKCSIWKAFARRGLGLYASTGSSTNDRIVTESFTPFGTPPLTSATAVVACSGAPLSYTATTATTGATFSWSRPVVAGISNPAGTGSSPVINETLINTTDKPVAVAYFIAVEPSTCPGVLQRVSVVINPNSLTVSNYAICQNAVIPTGQGLVVQPILTDSYSGTISTTSGTYIRPTGDNATSYVASGVNAYFHTYTFVAAASGLTSFEVVSASLSDFSDDTYLSLYQTSFNSATPAINFLRGNDDIDYDNGIYRSRVSHSLVQGTVYVLVTSTFYRLTTGSFTIKSTPTAFPVRPNWYATPSGGSILSTANIFNPVGVSGSGVPNTATPGVTTFYVANSLYPACRQTATLTILSTTPPVASGATITAGSSVSLTATGCTGGTLRWYQASDDAEVSLPVSPTASASYYARCQQTVGSTTCLSNNSNTVQVTIQVLTSFDTAMSGDWNAPSTWLCNCVPNGSLPVRIMNNHQVTVPSAYTGLAKKVTYTGTGKVIFQGSGKLSLAP